MTTSARLAVPGDRDRLVELMTEFYAESDYSLDVDLVAGAFAALLADGRVGRVWLLEDDGDVAGYVVMTVGYSMEYGGRDAFVDDLFVRPEFRGRGLGKLAVRTVRAACRELGVRALHLEVGRNNRRAQALYRRAGFKETNRQLLTLALESPSHKI